MMDPANARDYDNLFTTVDQGSQITVLVRNDGDVEATMHWHREPAR